MPEPAVATPTPLPLVVSAEDFEARVPEAHRPLYLDEDGGKRKRLPVDFGDQNPGALASALARQKADNDRYKADLAKWSALGGLDDVTALIEKAKATPAVDGKPDDAALQAARAALEAKETAWKKREAELKAAGDEAQKRWEDTERRSEFLREMVGVVKKDSIPSILRILMDNSRTELDGGKARIVHLDSQGSPAFGDRVEPLTTPERLAKLKADPEWRDHFVPSPANGSGAPPGKVGGGGGAYTPEQLDKMSMAEFAKLSAEGKFNGL